MNNTAYNQYEIIRHPKINEIAFRVHSFNRMASHFHHDLEVDLILEGRVLVRSYHDIFEVDAGSVVIFNAYEPHELTAITRECKTLTVFIKQDFCRTYFPDFSMLRFTGSHIEGSQFEEALAHESTDSQSHYLAGIRTSLFNLGYNYYLKDFGFELRCYSDLNSLVYALIKVLPYELVRGRLADATAKDHDRFVRILDYMESGYTERISLRELAEQENLSEAYLSHYIKDTLGVTFMNYVSMLRFEKAIQLLTQTDLNLLEICLESGFSESKYLNKMFQKNYGLSPKEFRRQFKSIPRKDQERNQQYTEAESLDLLRKHYAFSCDQRN